MTNPETTSHTFNVAPMWMWVDAHVRQALYPKRLEEVIQKLGLQVSVTRADCNSVMVSGEPDDVHKLVRSQAGVATWYPMIPHDEVTAA